MTVWYVNGAAAVTGTGTSASPFKTYAEAYAAAGNNDTIRLRTATYYEKMTIRKAGLTVEADTGHTPTFSGRYGPDLIGDPGNVGYTNYQGGRIRGTNQVPSLTAENKARGNWVIGSKGDSLVDVQAINVTLRGLTWRNAGGKILSSGNSSSDPRSCHNLLIENCRADYSYNGSFALDNENGSDGGPKTTGLRIVDTVITRGSMLYYDESRFADAGPTGRENGWWGGEQVSGCLRLRRTTGAVIDGCTVAYGYAEGIACARGTEAATVQNCTVHDQRHVMLYTVGGNGSVYKNNEAYHCTNLVEEFGKGKKKKIGGVDVPGTVTSDGLVIGDETASGGLGSPVAGQWFNNLVVNSCNPFEVRNNKDSYYTLLQNAYIGFNTFIGGPNPATTKYPNGFGNGYAGQINQVQQGSGKHNKTLVENNLFIQFASDQPIVGGSGNSGSLKPGITFRNNAYSKAAPAAFSGTNDVTATAAAMLFNPTLQIYDNNSYAPNMTNMPDPGNTTFDEGNYRPKDGGSVNSKASDGSAVTGVTIPSVTTDLTAVTRGSGTAREIGALENGGAGGGGDPSVSVSFTVSDETPVEGDTVTFNDTVTPTNCNVTGRAWTFGDGATSTATDPTHVYQTAGSYTARLNVTTDAAGVSGSYTYPSSIVVSRLPETADGAVIVAVTSATAQTSVTTQDITAAALGTLIPTAVRIVFTLATATDAAVDGSLFGVGVCANNASQQWAQVRYDKHGAATTIAKSRWTKDAIMLAIDENTVTGVASVLQFIPGGVRLNYTEAFPAAYQMAVTFWAGTGTKAQAGQVFIGAAGTGARVSTPWQPNLVLAYNTWGARDTQNSSAAITLGAAYLPPSYQRGVYQYVLEQHSKTNVADGTVEARIVTERIGLSRRTVTGSYGPVQLDGYDASGFDVTATSATNALQQDMCYLALALDCDIDVSVIDTPVATGNTDYARTFEPQAIDLIMSGLSAVDTLATSTSAGSFGLYTFSGSTGRGASVSSADAAATSNTQSLMSTAAELPSHTGAAFLKATPTLDADGITLNYTAVDATARKVIAVTYEATAATAPTTPLADFAANLVGDDGTLYDELTGFAPVTIQFVDLSNGNGSAITAWAWDFGDGGTSTEQNPEYTYIEPPTNGDAAYTVTLTVTSSGGDDTEAKADYVRVELQVSGYQGPRRIIFGPLQIEPVSLLGTTFSGIDPDDDSGKAGRLSAGFRVAPYLRFAKGIGTPGAQPDTTAFYIEIDGTTARLLVVDDDGTEYYATLTAV